MVKTEPVLKLLVVKDLPLIWLTVYQSYFWVQILSAASLQKFSVW